MPVIERFLTRLRARDRDELREYGMTVAQAAIAIRSPHVLAKVFEHEGEQACWIWFDALTPRALVASLLATEAWPRVARAVFRWVSRECRPHLLSLGYVRAECRVMANHPEAIRLLEHLGFQRECDLNKYGASGVCFHQYAWVLDA